MKPRILISCKQNMENYVNAVNNCGGDGYASYCPKWSDEYDGLLLSGGADIHPRYFGEEINGSKNIDELRDEAEFALVKAFVAQNKPIFGICRGFQVINVAFGGSMIQHIPNADKHHSSQSGVDLVHNITVNRDCFLYDIYGEEFTVNSAHHQAVNVPGKGLKYGALAMDGKTVEALQHETLPVFGVQWHPERMCFDKRRDDTVDGSGVFRYFIELCKR